MVGHWGRKGELMTRTLKSTRIKGLPPKVQLRTKDAVTGSYPAHVRQTSDNRTGMYRAFYDDGKTVDFKSYSMTPSASATHTGPGFNAEASYTGYNRGGDIILWMRAETIVSDGFGGLGIHDTTDNHNMTMFTHSYALSTDIPSYYNNVRDTFPNAYSLHISGALDGEQTVADVYSVSKNQTDFSGNRPFSISAHVKFDVMNTVNPVISRGVWNTHKADWALIVYGSGAIEFAIYNRGTGEFAGWLTDDTGWVIVGEWVHITVTFDGTSVFKCYINGVEVPGNINDSSGTPWTDFAAGNNDVYIGAISDNVLFGAKYASNGFFDQIILCHEVASLSDVGFFYSGSPIPGDVDTVAASPIGLALPAGLHTSNPALLRVDAYGNLVENREMLTDIVVAGPIRKGIGDSWVTFTPGQDLQPFRDDGHPAVVGKSVVSGSTQNPFYATGSRVADVGEGFSQPLWSKTKIEIDLTAIGGGQLNIRNAYNPGGAFKTQYQMGYFNFNTRVWTGLGDGFADYSPYLGTPDLFASSFINNSFIGFAPSMGIPESPNPIELNYGAAPLMAAGYPISQFGFPHNPKYAAEDAYLYPLSGVLSGPFLCEKMVVEFTASFDASSTNNFSPYYDSGAPENPGDQTYTTASFAVANFFILNQRKQYRLSLETHQTLGTLDYYENNPSAYTLTTSSIPQTVYGRYVDTVRDLVSYIGISSRGSEMTASIGGRTPTELYTRDLTLVGASQGPAGMSWNSAFMVSASIVSPSKTPKVGTFLPFSAFVDIGSIGDLPYEIDIGFDGGRLGLGLSRSSGRDFLSPLSVFPFTAVSTSFDNIIAGAGLGPGGIMLIQGTKDNFQKANPYLLMPSDNLVFGWQLPAMLNQTLNVNSGSLGPNFDFPVGHYKVTLYGSMISEGVEHHDTLNQLLTSAGVHEVIG